MDKWTEGPGGNVVRELSPGVFLSYQPMTDMPPGQAEYMDFLGSLAGFGKDSEETAIVNLNLPGGKYFILNGDFRTAFDGCTTFEQALEVFKANQDKVSPWSNGAVPN